MCCIILPQGQLRKWLTRAEAENQGPTDPTTTTKSPVTHQYVLGSPSRECKMGYLGWFLFIIPNKLLFCLRVLLLKQGKYYVFRSKVNFPFLVAYGFRNSRAVNIFLWWHKMARGPGGWGKGGLLGCFHSELVKRSEDTRVPWACLSYSLNHHGQIKAHRLSSVVRPRDQKQGIWFQVQIVLMYLIQQSQSDYCM